MRLWPKHKSNSCASLTGQSNPKLYFLKNCSSLLFLPKSRALAYVDHSNCHVSCRLHACSAHSCHTWSLLSLYFYTELLHTQQSVGDLCTTNNPTVVAQLWTSFPGWISLSCAGRLNFVVRIALLIFILITLFYLTRVRDTCSLFRDGYLPTDPA